MRVERPEAIEALKQYLLSNTAYPFLVAANSSADLKALTRSLPTRVHTISMSDYCTDDGLPDEDAVFNVLLNANNPILLKGAGELVMLSGNATFLRRIAGQTFSQKIIVLPESGDGARTSAAAKHQVWKQPLVRIVFQF